MFFSLNALEAILEDETTIKKKILNCRKPPPKLPADRKRRLFTIIKMISYPIKLKEEILLNVISKTQVKKINNLYNQKAIEAPGTKKPWRKLW